MNVALAGLTAREETALMMLVGKTLPSFQCSAVSGGRKVPLPSADLYVLDLAGRGLARWTDEAQESLLQSLDGTPAVLVAPAFDESWQALDAIRQKSQSLVMLHKPYGIEDMRAALLKAAPSKPVPAAPPTVAVRSKVRVPAASAPQAIAAPTVARPVAVRKLPTVTTAPVEIVPLSVAQFQAQVEALPVTESRLFLQTMAQALALRRPFEVRVTLLKRLIFSPDAQWAAGNIEPTVLQSLCQSDEFATDVSIDTIESMDAMARAQRLDMPVQPLAAFLGALMHHRVSHQV